jgi:hypothetical protein
MYDILGDNEALRYAIQMHTGNIHHHRHQRTEQYGDKAPIKPAPGHFPKKSRNNQNNQNNK